MVKQGKNVHSFYSLYLGLFPVIILVELSLFWLMLKKKDVILFRFGTILLSLRRWSIAATATHQPLNS
jgi:hypothetical protein